MAWRMESQGEGWLHSAHSYLQYSTLSERYESSLVEFRGSHCVFFRSGGHGGRSPSFLNDLLHDAQGRLCMSDVIVTLQIFAKATAVSRRVRQRLVQIDT